jgi:hypothetical protein
MTALQRPIGAKSIVTDYEYRDTYQGWQRLIVSPFRTRRLGASVTLYRLHTINGQWWHTARFASAADAIARAGAFQRHNPTLCRVAAPQTSFLV